MAHCWVLRQQDHVAALLVGVVVWDFVSGFPAATLHSCLAPFWGVGVWGVWCGVVV